MKVLIVDDSPTNLRLLRAVLEAENITVVQALDGLEAMNALEMEKVDAVFSDILMPILDGYKLCHELRKSERWRALPFIFYTATYTSPGDERLCYQVGGDKYLQKPAPSETILGALKEALESASRPSLVRETICDSDIMKEYSERLVSKLESKNVELSEAKQKLEETNQRLEHARVELQKANDDLESRVRQRTSELQSANKELEAFSYSVSHDLRAPVRQIAGFSRLVVRNAAAQLDESNAKHLQIIQHAAERMLGLIEAMLDLSKVSGMRFQRYPVDLSAVADDVAAELRENEADRSVQIEIARGMNDSGDRNLLRIALMNLLGNAWKFTSKTPGSRIEFGRIKNGADCRYYVRDNGAGFEMAHANTLFTAFQRLHSQDDFEGTGIGLATVQRIIQRHGGKIWAEGAPNEGATFNFTLGGEMPAPAGMES
jgi:hypothetical protein